MAEYTENFQLIKPAAEDHYSVADFNGNADIIDRQLKLAAETGKTAEELVVELSGLVKDFNAVVLQLKPRVTVLAAAGTAVSLKRGDVTVSGVAGAGHEVTLTLPEIGEWQMSYEYGGASYGRTVNVEHYGNMVVIAPPTLEAAPWAYIDRVSREGFAREAFSIGDEKSINVGGVAYAVVLLGYDHDDLAAPSGGRSKAGMTFQLKHCLNKTYPWHSNANYVGGWVDSEMRVQTLGNVLAGLDNDLRAVLKPVLKTTPSPLYSYVAAPQVTEDKLFLLSEKEVWGQIYSSSPYIKVDQQYEYYRLGFTTRKSVDNDLVTWWLRTPRWDSNIGVGCVVREHVTSTGTEKSTSLQYVSFAFCV